MARGKLICDACGEETDEIVSKLFLAPVIRGKTRTNHGNYTAHADVGVCCVEKLTTMVTWQKRLSREEYQRGRRLRASASVAKDGRAAQKPASRTTKR
jgi:hypothetical protein